MKNFIEMVYEKIENEDFLTIGRKYGDYHDLDSIVPASITVDSGVHIKGEWANITIPEGYEFSYNEFDEEYIFKYKELTIYFS